MFGYAFILSLGLLANPLANQNNLNNYDIIGNGEISYGQIFIGGGTEIFINDYKMNTDIFNFNIGIRTKVLEIGYKYNIEYFINRLGNTIVMNKTDEYCKFYLQLKMTNK